MPRYKKPQRLEGQEGVTDMRRGAQYVRMSSEHQQYSIANQSAAIALYAAAHNLGIVRSFIDGGKTGTTIKHRKGLQELLRTVESGNADFTDILVYDVSRWGRFPDSDESAYYEFLCKRAGLKVRYCAEQFENDNSTTSNLLKALKRTMAGEYSRELSVKISAGQRRLVSMGFWQGGPAPFGMARRIVDQNGLPKEVVGHGQWKSISTDRIVLELGSPEAIDTVRLAFDLYTKRHKSRHEIADILNASRRLRGKHPWTLPMLQGLLTNPVYKGAYAYGRHEKRSSEWRKVPPERWLVREQAFPAIITEKQWNEAAARMRDEVKPLVDAEMLEALKRLWKRKGKLNTDLINAAVDVPSVQAYKYQFDGINEAYRLIGYPIKHDLSFLRAIRLSRQLRDSICDKIRDDVKAIGGSAESLLVPGMLRLNGGTTVKVTVVKGWDRPGLNTVWRLLLGEVLTADVVVFARLKAPARTVLDYFVIPAISGMRGSLTVRERDNDPSLEIYRFDDLQTLIESFREFSIPRCR
jgi:DNA invertase Pin-like site-specific DNA recombinase